ncbi:hypothetical protein GS438_21790 [Rhodococcus hoagii]|nr:hypothetical protein [Prescottella equi]
MEAERIVVLRDSEALATLGIDLADAWRRPVRTADRHPSRTAPGLWHLTLFRRNEDGAPG